MKSLVLILFGSMWLMLIIKWILGRHEQRSILPEEIYDPAKPWVNSPCLCGIDREDWKIIAANRSGLKFLLACPNCSCKWEETTIGGKSMWRKVEEDYIRCHYDLGDLT